MNVKNMIMTVTMVWPLPRYNLELRYNTKGQFLTGREEGKLQQVAIVDLFYEDYGEDAEEEYRTRRKQS